jgi:D-xylose transport system substrate-binding protein
MKLAVKALILFSAATLFLIGCVSGPSEQGGPGRKKDPNAKIKIGFAMATLKEERWNRDKDLFEKHAKELGAEVVVTVANNSDANQANQVDNLLTQNVDVLVIAPHNAQTAASMVAKAKAQGVPVISYDRLINSDDIALYISHQVARIGQMQAEYALKNAPTGNYIMVYGASTDNNALIMKEAQLKVLKPAIDRGDIKIIAEQHATDWRPEEALKIVENALTQAGNKVNVVIASNDGTAGGAVSALEKVGLAEKVIVTGQDAELAALQRIAEGKQTMTVYKPIQPLAYGAVEAAIKLAKGEKVDSNASLKAVNKEVPSLLYDPQVVDISNILQTVVKDGYHKLEDVYKNVPKEKWPKP